MYSCARYEVLVSSFLYGTSDKRWAINAEVEGWVVVALCKQVAGRKKNMWEGLDVVYDFVCCLTNDETPKVSAQKWIMTILKRILPGSFLFQIIERLLPIGSRE